MSSVDISNRYRGGVVEKLAEGDRFTVTADTGEALTGGRLCEFASGDRVVALCTEDSLVCAGVALWNIKADDTDRKVTVATEGVWMLRASGAINPGDVVVPAANGAVKAADAHSDPRSYCGRAVAHIANGADGPVMVDTV